MAHWTPPRHVGDPKLRQVFTSLGEHMVDPDDAAALEAQVQAMAGAVDLLRDRQRMRVHRRTIPATVDDMSVNLYTSITANETVLDRGPSGWLSVSGADWVVNEAGTYRVLCNAEFDAPAGAPLGFVGVGFRVLPGGTRLLDRAPNSLVGGSASGEGIAVISAGATLQFRVQQSSTGAPLSTVMVEMSLEKLL